MSQSLKQVQKQVQVQVMRAIQAQRAQVLESSSDALEARLAYLVKENPALRWRGPARPRGAVDKSYARGPDPDMAPLEARWAASTDLMEILLNDYRLERTTPEEREAGAWIIGNLDHRGLLATTLEEISERTEIPLASVQSAQAKVMELEPEGCGATDLLHYLEFMVRKLYPEDPWFPDLVALHFDDIKSKKYKRIAESMELDIEDVEEYASMLGDVDPWPARGYGEDPMEHIVPTMDVVRDPETGALKVEFHDPPKARVMIDPRFEDKILAMEDADKRREARQALDEARAVVQQIEARHSLVAQIAKLAVREQRAYFDRGAEYIRSLTMKEVAERVNVDASSVSRAVKGRYYQFEGRVEELRLLFSHRSKAGKVSEQKLHAMLREIVSNEDPRRPLTDVEIRDALRRRGIYEARRTVAKHRKRAGIASSRDRKRVD
jgi:RNA polymerase sigma-54 factor